MSLTYTNQHYQWQERVNKETMFAIRFKQSVPTRFFNTSSRFQKTFPALQRLSPYYNSANIQPQQTVSTLKRPNTSKVALLSVNPPESSNTVSNNLRNYIKDLESQLRSEKLKRIKSESLLKSYSLLNQQPKNNNLKSDLKSKDLKKPS